jgi:outer membrane protein assembly factor BamE (lipoprotein component of BamABCDE complex)
MRSLYINTLVLFFLLACSAEKEEKTELLDNEIIVEGSFDKSKWRVKEGKDYPFREQMLDAVVYNDTIRSLNKDEVLDLLGEPSYYRNNENFLYYTIAQKRIGLWPLYTKTMIVKLTEENNIDWIKVHK